MPYWSPLKPEVDGDYWIMDGEMDLARVTETWVVREADASVQAMWFITHFYSPIGDPKVGYNHLKNNFKKHLVYSSSVCSLSG